MIYSVDRLEGPVAVLEDDDGVTVCVAVSLLPFGTHAGDVLLLRNGVYEYDAGETASRKKRIHALEQRLRGDRQK